MEATETVQDGAAELKKIRALGYSHTMFNPARPGRLCRGRERWIEPYKMEGEVSEIHRHVFTGSVFKDDSAAEALRGLPHSEVDVPALIWRLYPDKKLIAFMEDGHPADIPEKALGIEAYEGYRAGKHEVGLVRWFMPIESEEHLKELMGTNPWQFEERVRCFAAVDDETDAEALNETMFRFLGMSTLDSPPARYQPSAFPEMLDEVHALIVLHRDKHGPALGVYANEERELDGLVKPLCDDVGTLAVPFAIPPMLARWDRALSELRADWVVKRDDEFPVPPAAEPSEWSRRRGRRNKKKKRNKSSDEE